jgi:hypothetical protein
MFENFDKNQTHLWPREEDARGSRHSFDIREIVKGAGLKYLGRRVDVQC